MSVEAPPVTPEPHGYPVGVEIDYPERLSRLLIFVKWLLAIPHYIILILYIVALWFVAIIAFFAILFTGNIPRGIWEFILGYTRWSLRVSAYVGLLRDEYPPFTNEYVSEHPVRVTCDYPDRLSRGLIFIKWLIVIPHWIILIFYGLAAFIVTIIAWFAILITGSYPKGLFDFVVGYARWNTRVVVYSGQYAAYNPYIAGLLRDEYPPFSNAP